MKENEILETLILITVIVDVNLRLPLQLGRPLRQSIEKEFLYILVGFRRQEVKECTLPLLDSERERASLVSENIY